MMKWWIVGHDGLVASALRSMCSDKQIPWVSTGRGQVDITDLDAVIEFAKQEKPTHLINAAAYTDVDGAETHRDVAFAVNAQGAENVAIAAWALKARCLHISTDYVFNGRSTVPYREGDQCDPLNVYGLSKLEGEQRVMMAHPEACIIRTSWLFGALQRQKGSLIARLIALLQEKTELQMVMDQQGRPTSSQDLSEAVFKLRDHLGLVHFSNEGAASRYQIAMDLRAWMETKGMPVRCLSIIPVESALFPRLAPRPSYSVLDTALYTSLVGQAPSHWLSAFEQGLR